MRFGILKTGVFKDNQGREHSITDETLDKIAAQFNERKEEVPITIGHPKGNAPSWGWIDKIEKVGSELYASAKKIVPAFLEAAKQGLYKNRSISFNKDTHQPLHVAFLGAEAPAVPGLGDVEFSAETDEHAVVEFSLGTNDVQDDPAPVVIEQSKLQEEFEALKLQLDALKAENSNLNKRLTDMQSEQREAAFSAKLDNLISVGKVLPAERDTLRKLFITIDRSAVEFSADDENNPMVAFEQSLEQRPVILNMSQTPAPTAGTEAQPKPKPGTVAAIRSAML